MIIENKLDESDVGKWLYDYYAENTNVETPICISISINSIKEADIVLCASNSPDPLIFPEMIGGDSKVICDISVPMNTHPSVINECPNVIFLQ